MSHTIFHTPGIIIGVQNSGESSRRIALITPELGLISVIAQSARESKKVSVATQWLSYGQYDCVLGSASGWRLVGADMIASYASADTVVISAYSRRCQYLSRFIIGEQPDPQLFALISSEFVRLPTILGTGDDVRSFLEFQYIVLSHIGYIADGVDVANIDSSMLRQQIAQAQHNAQL